MMLKSIIILVILAVASPTFAGTLYAFIQKDCKACEDMEPVLKKLGRKGHKVVRIDVHKFPKLTAKYKVTETPTFIAVDKQGTEKGREVGVTDEGALLAILRIVGKIFVGIIKLFLL